MTDNLTTRYGGVLERTADGGVIRFERQLSYDIDDVWDAITTPERLADWWLPFDADITVDTGCILRLSHTVTDVQDAIDNCYLVGLQTSLDRLEPSLAARPEPWDWNAFAIGQAHHADLGLAAPMDPS